MGCNPCGFNEDKSQLIFPFGKEEIGVNKPSQSKDFSDFMSKFDQNLHYFGKYIDPEELKKIIPEEFINYMKENPFKIVKWREKENII